MHVITSRGGQLQRLVSPQEEFSDSSRRLFTGLAALDELAPGGGFDQGAVHEVLSDGDTPSFLLPILLSRAAVQRGRVVWCDSQRQLYPPAILAMGLPLDQWMVLQPRSVMDEVWAVAECLRCRRVAACVAALPRLSRIQARRLQLAAERGGGMGIIVRSAKAVAWPYAAATRWLVRSITGERRIQRWSVELLHGHGGRVGQRVFLELCRETHHVRAFASMVDRANPPKTISAIA